MADEASLGFIFFRWNVATGAHEIDLSLVDEWGLQSGEVVTLNKKGRWDLPSLVVGEAARTSSLLEDEDLVEPLVRVLQQTDGDFGMRRFWLTDAAQSLKPFVVATSAEEPANQEESTAASDRTSRSALKAKERRAAASAARKVWPTGREPCDVRAYLLYEPAMPQTPVKRIMSRDHQLIERTHRKRSLISE